jgi:hypothetical protein
MNPLTALLTAPVLAIAPLLDPVPAPADVKPGWIAFAVFLGLVVATLLLWFSMRKQLGKIRFREEPDATDSGSTPDADAAGTENGSGPR